jgi:cytochrome c peroxidase
VFLPIGGPTMSGQGIRSSPTIGYLFANKAFRFENGEPFGGFTWDGRANSLAEQAGGPFFDHVEMANEDLADLMTRVRRAEWLVDFLNLFEIGANATDDQIFENMKLALASYEIGDSDYLLFNSKYDKVLTGEATLTAQEARGLALFEEPTKGNCTACHTSSMQSDFGKPLFTNFSYHALALPRSAATRNLNASFYDLGLCGPNRTDLASRTDLCGKFKTPTLRNVALTGPYFHNASIASLTDAVRFHVTRDTDPGRWYPTEDGEVQQYNDLPAAYRANIVRTPPFDRDAGDEAALTDSEIEDIVAFLHTLTDTFPEE